MRAMHKFALLLALTVGAISHSAQYSPIWDYSFSNISGNYYTRTNMLRLNRWSSSSVRTDYIELSIYNEGSCGSISPYISISYTDGYDGNERDADYCWGCVVERGNYAFRIPDGQIYGLRVQFKKTYTGYYGTCGIRVWARNPS